MCKLCDEIKPKGWNFCPICGREINIPKYNTNATFRELLEQVTIEHKEDSSLSFKEAAEIVKEKYKNAFKYLKDN